MSVRLKLGWHGESSSDGRSAVRGTAGAVPVLLLLLLAAWLLYSFDPWLGLVVGVVVSMFAIMFVAKAISDERTAPPPRSGGIAVVDNHEEDQ